MLPRLRWVLTNRTKVCLIFIWNLYKAVILSGYSDNTRSNVLMPVEHLCLRPCQPWRLEGLSQSPGVKGKTRCLQWCPSFLPLCTWASLSLFSVINCFFSSPYIFDNFLFLTLRHKVDCFIFLTPKPHKVKSLLSCIMVLLFFFCDYCPQYTQSFLPFLNCTA